MLDVFVEHLSHLIIAIKERMANTPGRKSKASSQLPFFLPSTEEFFNDE